jgi:hypothetical protein
MRALTVRRPWANLIAARIKRVENRPWMPDEEAIGERIAIHAGGKWDRRAKEYFPEHVTEDPDAYAGGIVAVARIACIVQGPSWKRIKVVCGRSGALRRLPNRSLEPFYDGPYGWVLVGIRRLSEPIECPGQLRLWYVSRAIERRIKRQLS